MFFLQLPSAKSFNRVSSLTILFSLTLRIGLAYKFAGIAFFIAKRDRLFYYVRPDTNLSRLRSWERSDEEMVLYGESWKSGGSWKAHNGSKDRYFRQSSGLSRYKPSSEGNVVLLLYLLAYIHFSYSKIPLLGKEKQPSTQ